MDILNIDQMLFNIWSITKKVVIYVAKLPVIGFKSLPLVLQIVIVLLFVMIVAGVTYWLIKNKDAYLRVKY